MFSFRSLSFSLLASVGLIGCGQTLMHMNHTLVPHSGQSKPSANCQAAHGEIVAALRLAGVPPTAKVITLANGVCAEQITFEYGAAIKDILNKFVNSKSFTYYQAKSGQYINLWIDQPADVFLDSKGKAMDTTPTDADCNQAAKDLLGKFDDTTVTAVFDKHKSTGPLRCYVDLLFTRGDSGYADFLNWNNSSAGTHREPFHWHITTKGVTHIVYIHAISAIPQN